MLKLFSKCFEAVCSILAVINFIAFGAFGGYLGYYIGNNILGESPVLYAVLVGIAGIAIAFFINVLIFGFISQIFEIRKNLELLNKKSN